MNIEQAKEARRVLNDLEAAKHQLSRLKSTREFTSLSLTGEDGTKRQYSFRMSYKDDKAGISSVRKHLVDLWNSRIDALEEQLNSL